jgi:hypothetical protein
LKINDEHFDRFKKEFNKWFEKFGLYGWHIIFFKKDLGHKGACIVANCEDRIAEVTLNSNLDNDSIEANGGIERTIDIFAFHEADELRHYRIEELVWRRMVAETDIREAIHELIRQDEKLIFK